ncbi:MAG: tetratricopeptide repeat protein [Lachnospiraceae bacterium]|nr:tetratricopeptide repeat protein [Lachnospiraceae bacterium]
MKRDNQIKGKPKGRAVLWAAVLAAAVLSLGGCKEKGPDKQELRMAGIEKLDAGDYSGAIIEFDAAIQASTGKVGAFEIDVLKYRAEAEYMLKDYQAAAHTYDVLLQVDKKEPEYLYLDAAMKALGGDTDGALEAYREGVELEQKAGGKGNKKTDKESGKENDQQEASGETAGFGRTEALTAVGEACLQDGRQEEVSALYDEAVQDGAAGPSVFNSMGLTYMEAGQYQEALECFDRAIQAGNGQGTDGAGTDPAVRNARFNQAVVYEYQGRYQEALQAFQSYVSQFGPDEAAQKEITFLQTR